jgi:hypothetical protein
VTSDWFVKNLKTILPGGVAGYQNGDDGGAGLLVGFP